ncbi:MAG: chaperonin GroEL [Candidatus Moraniibacteriota bacterium]|nr:MAG: chaperonin GroEL [Candidatus Moranbacteria bacterium]
MAKQIEFSTEARKKIVAGIDTVADAVKTTIGPKGRNVVLDKGFGAPTVTNDGVSIAKDIELEDKFENIGAELIKEVADKTNDAAGDGTTTSTIMTQAIVNEGLKFVETGINPVGIRKGLESAKNDVIAILQKNSKRVSNKEEIAQVATISAENVEMGTMIANVMEQVGKDGVITVEESQTVGLSYDVVEGMQFDKGYVSPYMISDAESRKAEIKDPAILITDKKISAINDILPLLEKIAQSGKKDLVIICEDLEGEALATLVVNKLRGTMNVLAVKAPEFGDTRKDVLEDIAIVTGATVIAEDKAMTMENVDLDVLGSAAKVVSTKDDTTIVDGKGTKRIIKERAAQIARQAEMETSNYEKEKLQKRVAKLSGGVAVIRAGAATETEMSYVRHKLEDALAATKAAVEEGIVAGGGTALAKAATVVKVDEEANNEFRAGYETLLNALSAPLKQIAKNAGERDAAVVFNAVIEGKGKNYGYNALDDVYEDDMVKSGIIDPLKVTRTAIENAVSVASMLLTTEAVITDKPEENGGGMDTAAAAAMGGMGGGMPMM